MDDTTILWIILTGLMLVGIMAGAYYFQQLIPPLGSQELELYHDFNAEMKLSGNVVGWTNIQDFGINYTKLVYVNNPNEFNVTLDLFWEAFPNEMTQFCKWSSSMEDGSVITPGINELYLHCLVEHNEYFYTHGEVITQIKVREP